MGVAMLRPQPAQKFFKIIGSYRKGVLKFVVDELVRRGFRPTREDALASVFWSRSFFSQLAQLQPYQKVNFFPAMAEIARKDFLNRSLPLTPNCDMALTARYAIGNIKRFRARFGEELFDFWPVGFNLPVEMPALRADFTARPAPYILKPPLAARGEGIRLITSLEELDNMPDYVAAKIPLAQRYLPNPMLFHGHKMTFRLYVTITSWDPLRIYVYHNGLVRICSAKYETTTESFSNLFVQRVFALIFPPLTDRPRLVHLTNYDLQMDKEAEFNAEIPADAFHDGLRSELGYIFNEIQKTTSISSERIWNDIHKLIACSIIPAEDYIQPWVARKVPYRNNCFEILGYDVLVDETGKPWLLEINHTPSLSPHTELENGIKKDMLRELMDLVDIGNSDVATVVRTVQELDDLLIHKKAALPERYGQPERSWKGDELDLMYLTRADIWALVDTEFEV